MMKCYFWFLFELCSKPFYMFLRIYERAIIARYGVHWKTIGIHIYSFHTEQIIKMSKGCPIISFKIKTTKNVLLFIVYWWETGKYWSCYRFFIGKKNLWKAIQLCIFITKIKKCLFCHLYSWKDSYAAKRILQRYTKLNLYMLCIWCCQRMRW
jgi:hypothetical protein